MDKVKIAEELVKVAKEVVGKYKIHKSYTITKDYLVLTIQAPIFSKDAYDFLDDYNEAKEEIEKTLDLTWSLYHKEFLHTDFFQGGFDYEGYVKNEHDIYLEYVGKINIYNVFLDGSGDYNPEFLIPLEKLMKKLGYRRR